MVRGLLEQGPMTIFDVLRRSHREVEGLFGDLQNAISTDQVELARAMLQLVSIKLISGMRAEHAVVYPRFAREAGLLDEVAMAIREHEGIEHLIDLLRVGGLRLEDWCMAVAQLGRLVADHTDTEEATLFRSAGRALSPGVLDQLAREYVTHVRMVAPVAGTSITYELSLPEQPETVVVRFKAA